MEHNTLYYTIAHTINRYGTPEYRVMYLPTGYTSPCRLRGVYRGQVGTEQAHEALLSRFADAQHLDEKAFSQLVKERKQQAKETEPIILAVALTPAEFANLRNALTRSTGVELDDEVLRRAARSIAQQELREVGEAEHSQNDEGDHQITVNLDAHQFERFREASAYHHGIAAQNFNDFLCYWSAQKTIYELINSYCDEAEGQQQITN